MELMSDSFRYYKIMLKMYKPMYIVMIIALAISVYINSFVSLSYSYMGVELLENNYVWAIALLIILKSCSVCSNKKMEIYGGTSRVKIFAHMIEGYVIIIGLYLVNFVMTLATNLIIKASGNSFDFSERFSFDGLFLNFITYVLVVGVIWMVLFVMFVALHIFNLSVASTILLVLQMPLFLFNLVFDTFSIIDSATQSFINGHVNLICAVVIVVGIIISYVLGGLIKCHKQFHNNLIVIAFCSTFNVCMLLF